MALEEEYHVPSTPFLMLGSVLVVAALNLDDLPLGPCVAAALTLAVTPSALKARARKAGYAAAAQRASGGGERGSGARSPGAAAEDPELCLVRPDEREAIDALGRELSEELCSLPQFQDLVGERRLLRFLRGHGTVRAAAKAYRDMMRHREEVGADALRRKVARLPWRAEEMPWLRPLQRVLPIEVDAGRTAAGHMVTIELPGRLDAQRLLEIPHEEFRDAYLSLMELRTKVLDEMSQECGRLVKVTQIRDLRRFTNVYPRILQNPSIMVRLKSVIGASMTAHPESVDRVIMLNVPTVFYTIFAMISPMLTERLKRKFTFVPKPHDPRLLFEVGGADTLLALSRLASPGADCPGRGKESLPADDFLELAVRVPQGATLRWDWSARDVEFSLCDFPGAPGPPRAGADGPVQALEPRRCSGHEGSHSPGRPSVCLLRWSNVHSWATAKELSYFVSVERDAKKAA